jgi:ATP-binding cassette subfamily F protein 3
MLTIENLKYGYTTEYILNEVNATIGPGQKIGLVGVNGAGKSTLMQIIAGKLAPEFGQIHNSFTTGYIAQELNENLINIDARNIEDFINFKQEYPFEYHQIARLLAMIGMKDKTPHSEFQILSGGQKTKVAIVKILLEEPELLLLDEPTNFLDIKASQWLMDYLNDYKGAILVISHDLELMNRGLDKIWFLNEFTHKIEKFKGNYSDFLAQKELEDELLTKKIKKQKKEYKKLLKISEHLKGLKGDKSKMAGARYREKALEMKKKIPKKRKKSKKINIRYDINKRANYEPVKVQNVSKSFKGENGLNQVLYNINFSLKRKNRMVIIGANGVGKSTLLKIIMGKMKAEDGPDGKAHIEIGDNIDVGYYAQEYDNLNHSNTPLEEFPKAQQQKVRGFLGSFLISGNQVFQQISSLSGGEKTRLALAKIFFEGPNLLILDEPTTFLDPASQKILKQALVNYPETIMLVSHDEDLVKAIKPTHTLLLPEEKFTSYLPEHLKRVSYV